MSADPSFSGESERFPITRWPAVLAARSVDPEERARALDVLLAAYWKPIYKYIRLRWGKSRVDAEDLTQDFFMRLLEKKLLSRYDPARARLRTFLRACLDSLVANWDRADRQQKRGGGALHVSLDFAAAEGELQHLDPPAPAGIEQFFEREWARSVFSAGVEGLRRELAARNKAIYFQVFERYDLADVLSNSPDRHPTYRGVARELDLTPIEVTNYLGYARREFRRIVLDFLRDTTATEQEFRLEARALLGVAPQ